MAKDVTVKIDMVTARTVERVGASFLVEYPDGDDLKRVILPTPVDGPTPVDELETGIPYGADWSNLIKPASPSGADFGRELRRRGVWTAEDARTRTGDVFAAIQAVYGIDLAAILTAEKK